MVISKNHMQMQMQMEKKTQDMNQNFGRNWNTKQASLNCHSSRYLSQKNSLNYIKKQKQIIKRCKNRMKDGVRLGLVLKRNKSNNNIKQFFKNYLLTKVTTVYICFWLAQFKQS